MEFIAAISNHTQNRNSLAEALDNHALLDAMRDSNGTRIAIARSARRDAAILQRGSS
jgi:hypothetical protein